MRIPSLRPIALVAALLVAPSAAQAGWNTAFSGSADFVAPSPSANGAVSYAVYDTAGMTQAQIKADLGTPFYNALFSAASVQSGTVASLQNSRYLYFYEVVNTPAPVGTDLALKQLLVGGDQALLSAAGAVNGYVFADGAGAVGPVGNTHLGPETPPLPTGVTPSPFAADAAAKTSVYGPTATQLGQPLGQTAFAYNFVNPDPVSGKERGLLTNDYSAVMFAASNSAPVFVNANLYDGGPFTVGLLPAPAPEPGTMALLALGLPLAGTGYVRRLRRAATPA